MRLFLSSWYLRPEQRFEALRPRSGRGRAGVVLNARDELGANRVRSVDREYGRLESLGYTCEDLDLREYFDAPQTLPGRLRDLDLVWAVGGNSFVLARAMVRSGFYPALRERLADDDFIYGGYSAGVCVMTPDLEGIHLVDDPAVLPDGYLPDVEPAGAGLVPFRILPHWRSGHLESELIDKAEAYLAAAGLEYRCLRDGQAFVVTDDDVELVDL